jgi:hypothetical protein
MARNTVAEDDASGKKVPDSMLSEPIKMGKVKHKRAGSIVNLSMNQ